MNDRERFLNLMSYRPVDRLPVMAVETHVEGPALARWRREGLPADRQPGEFLGIHAVFEGVPLPCGPVPGFESRRLSESADEGGYLPALDDVVPPEVPFDTYRYFVDALRAVVP